MLLFFIIFFLLSASMFLAVSCTRRYQLGQLAKRYNMQYDYYRESVTTFETAGRLEFFTHFFHQYNNVCTFSNNAAFMRFADDIFFVDDKPGTKPQKISIFTAELKSSQFAPFKIVPAGSLFARSQYPQIKSNVPEIDKHYQIYSPSTQGASFLTPALQAALKNRSNIYLEANNNALIYHEQRLIPSKDFQTFRLRGMQLLQACQPLPQRAQTAARRQAEGSSSPEESLLSAFSLPQANAEDGSKTRIGIGIFALLLLAIGLTLFAWVLIKNLPH